GHGASRLDARGGQEAGQLDFQHVGVHAFDNRDDAFDRHLLERLFFAEPQAQLAGGGEQHEVGGAHAIDGGHEGHGNAFAYLFDVIQVLHDLDQSEDRSDDADGGREAACSLEDCGNLFLHYELVVDAQFHNLAQLGGLGSIDGQAQRLSQKRVVNSGQVGVEGDDAAAARLVGVGHQLLHGGGAGRGAVE